MQNIKERQEFENYNKIKLLGEGSFGKAFLVERASDKLKCVMKQIDISKMSDTERKETVKEAKILEVLSHPNIVKFIEVFKTKNGKLCIVMDFADGGDLQNRIKEQRGRAFSESQVLEWFTQICLGLKHIHDRKILHRDLKGQNIFLTSKGIVKIGDFGIAKVLASTMQNARTVVGTPYYLSPEIVQSRPYNFKSDMWSMGVILYELCALKPPFDAPSLHFLAMKIVRGAFNPLPSGFSSEMKSVVAQLLNTNERNRPDVNKVLSMPIMQNRIKVFLTETIYQKEFSHTILHKQNVFDPKGLPMRPVQNILPVAQANGKMLPPVNQKQEYKSPIALPSPASNQVAQRYNPAALNRPQVNQTPVQPQRQNPTPIQGNYQINKNGVSPGMAAAFGGSPKQNPPRPQPYGNNQPGQAPKLNYHYQNQQNNQNASPLGIAPANNIMRPQSAMPQVNPSQQKQIEANIAKAKAVEVQKIAQVQALAHVEAQAKQQAMVAKEQAKIQVQANEAAAAKRALEEREHKERMKQIEDRLKQKEIELKKMDDVKREREYKAREAEMAVRAARQKEEEQKRVAAGAMDAAKKDKERRALEEMEQARAIRKIKEKEAEEGKKRMLMEEQARKLQDAHLQRKEEIDKLKRDEIQRRQHEEQRKKEEARKEQAKVISERIEKQVQKAKVPPKEGTDINMVVKMAAQNVANNILNVEKKINAQSPNQSPTPQMPAIQGQKVHNPANKIQIPVQQAKPLIQAQVNQKEPPQSARQIHSAQDWNKKPKITESESSRPTTAASKKVESPQEKLRLQELRKKERNEQMKVWKDKWQERESKNVSPLMIGIAATPEKQHEPTSDKKTRNIEMIKAKPIAQTASNWKKHDENEANSTPSKIITQIDKKIEVYRDNILKERSPQPQRVSPKKELEIVSNQVQIKHKSPSTSISHHVEETKTLKSNKSGRSGNHSKNTSPHHHSPAQNDNDYNDVYKMLEEMAGIVKMNFDQIPPPLASSDEEEKKKGEESDDEDNDESDDDDFGTDRDINWADARQRRKSKSPLRGGHKKAAIIEKKAEVAVIKQAEVMTFNVEEIVANDEEDASHKQYFDHTLQTIQEAGSEAENTMPNRNTLPSNGQDLPKESSDEGEDRQDDIIDDEEPSTDTTISNGLRHDFTFMGGNDEASAAFDEISRFTSVEQTREFLEKELGEERLMKAYPKLKEFGDQILFFERAHELEAILKGILTLNEIKKYQPYFATWIFMELQAETPDVQTGVKQGADVAMKTFKNINTTAKFGKLI